VKERPNIVFLLNDHQAYYGHGEMAGGPKIHRPSFEKLASEGIEFTQAYAACPLCAPVRRSMLTGLYPHIHGELTNTSFKPFKYDTYLDILAENGYKNYYYGKWHAGSGTAHDHQCEGFSYPDFNNPYDKSEYKKYLKKIGLPEAEIEIIFSFMDPRWKLTQQLGIEEGKIHHIKGEWSLEHAVGLMTTPKETHEAFFLAHLACEKLKEIAESNNEKPFHLRVDFWGPHHPYYPTKEFLNLYNPKDIPIHPNFTIDLNTKPKIYQYDKNYPISERGKLIQPNPLPWPTWQKILSYCYAQTTLVDQAGGMIIDMLDKLGLSENTFVIWTTDHGDAVACHGGHFNKDCYMPQEMVRIPMAVRYPGKVAPNQKSEKIISNLDIPSTFLDLAGAKFSHNDHSRSLLPLFYNPNAKWEKDLMIETHGLFHRHVGRMIVTNRYKYIWNDGDMDELYDLKDDPFELNNLISKDKYSEILEDLKRRLNVWRQKTNDNITIRMMRRNHLG
jgi:arylsulfatase A-like enzyme